MLQTYPGQKKQTHIPLELVKFAGTNIEFYFADATGVNSDINKANQNLESEKKKILEKLLLSGIHKFFNDRHDASIRILKNGKGEKTIYEVDNRAGIRAHFIEADPFENKPVILYIAGYHKNNQSKVLGEIADEDRKETKYRGKG